MKERLRLEGIIPESSAGLRLDQALAQLFPQHSRSRLAEWIKKNQVLVNDQHMKTKDKVSGLEMVKIDAELEIVTHWEPQSIQLNIIDEDEALLIVNKPTGMVVHPASGNPNRTLVNALLNYYPPLAQLPRAGLIHRLDKDTSGLLIIAKTLTAHTALVNAMKLREIKRQYCAIVNGVIISGGKIETAFGRHPRQRLKMAVLASGKKAISHYRVLERFRAHSFIQVNLETGRTHQIRVHLAHIHFPIVGDPLYGARIKIPANADPSLETALRAFKHQALHAQQLSLSHPLDNQMRHWQAPIPDDMEQLLELLKKDCSSVQL